MGIQKLKAALLATVALGAAATAAPVFATEPAPTEMAQPLAAPVLHADEDQAPVALKKAGLMAAAAATLAALGALIGWKRIRRAVHSAGPVLVSAAKTAAKAPAAALRAVGEAAAKPFRLVAGLAALAIFALFGVWLYDVEWLGGLAAGAGGVAIAWLGTARVARFARPVARRPQTRRGARDLQGGSK